MANLFQFSIPLDDPLSTKRISFPPVLFGYHWEKKSFQVNFDYIEEGKVVELILCEEKTDERLNHFIESESLALKEGHSLAKISNGSACINLGEAAENISKNSRRTNPVFVVVFRIDGIPRKISERFHVRSKWSLSKNEEANIDSLIQRIRAMERIVPNETFIKNIEIVKQQWRDAKEETKTREQRIATATWLQTKLVNFSEYLPASERYTKIEKNFFKIRKPNRSPPKSLEIIQDLLKEVQVLEGGEDPIKQLIPVQPELASRPYFSQTCSSSSSLCFNDSIYSIIPSEIQLSEESKYMERNYPLHHPTKPILLSHPLPVASSLPTSSSSTSKKRKKICEPEQLPHKLNKSSSSSSKKKKIQSVKVSPNTASLLQQQQETFLPYPGQTTFLHSGYSLQQPLFYPLTQPTLSFHSNTDACGYSSSSSSSPVPALEEPLMFGEQWGNPEAFYPFLLSNGCPSYPLFYTHPSDSTPSDQIIYYLSDFKHENPDPHCDIWTSFDDPHFEELDGFLKN